MHVNEQICFLLMEVLRPPIAYYSNSKDQLTRNASELITSGNCIQAKGVETLSASILSVSSQEDGQPQTTSQEDGQPQTTSQEDGQPQTTLQEDGQPQATLQEETETANDISDDQEFTAAVNGLVEHFEVIKGERNLELYSENRELLEMIAGYLAYRLKKIEPEKASLYGSLTKGVSFSGKNWLYALSRRSLMKPTEKCMQYVLKMEEEFIRFHGGSVNKDIRVFTTLKDKIKMKYPEIDDFVVMCFVRTRTFIRIKSLNKRRTIQSTTNANVLKVTKEKTPKNEENCLS
ncbi:hypothetical protein J6590_069382, partial [Homalodisca vitripennis]